jgi:hypothetical protein
MKTRKKTIRKKANNTTSEEKVEQEAKSLIDLIKLATLAIGSFILLLLLFWVFS